MSQIRHEISYGKVAVPIYRVFGAPLRGVTPILESPFTGRDNVLVAREVDIQVLGENFLPAYTHGDNSAVVATDSMKNVILREALDHNSATLEGFLHHLGNIFLTTYPEMHRVRLSGRELPFAPERVPDGDGGFVDSDVLFGRNDGDFSSAMLEMDIDGGTATVHDHQSGREGLRLLKVTGSAFTSFVRDGNTTLPERRDRPLYIYLDVHWRYRALSDLLGDSHAAYAPAEQVRDLVAAVFHEFVSESIQHLVHEMGTRILERFPGLSEVSFVAQNRTRDPFYRSESDPRVVVYSDPFPAYGEITLRMVRDEV
jgi:urate oxidase